MLGAKARNDITTMQDKIDRKGMNVRWDVRNTHVSGDQVLVARRVEVLAHEVAQMSKYEDDDVAHVR